MSQDIVADALNQIMNAKKARKDSVLIKRNSKLLSKILDILKSYEYLDYELKDKTLIIKIKNLNSIRAIKPRYTVSVNKINKYVRRYLPAKNFGFVIVSTNKGLMIHSDALDKNLGGCLIAYVF